MLFFNKKRLPVGSECESIDSPFGIVRVDEFSDHYRFMFGEDHPFFLRVEGDLLKVSFNAIGIIKPENDLRIVIWMLNSATVRQTINSKFGNKPELEFSAARYVADGNGRSVVVLPDDTPTTAFQRLERVWYKQAPMEFVSGDLVSRVE